MTLEEARNEDLETLHQLIERAYRGDTARQGWSHEADLLSGPRTSVAELQAILDDPARHLLVCRDGDGSVRCCVMLWEKGDGLVYLGMLTIDPALQGTGRGKKLLAAAERSEEHTSELQSH